MIMKQIATAFVWAFALSQCLGLALAGLLFWLDWPWWYYPLALGSYTLWFAWVDAKELLAKRLGNKGDYTGVKHKRRSIPINTQTGTVFMSVMPFVGKRQGRELEVDGGFTLYSKDCEVSESLTARFVRGAQIRQDRGKSPFSRPFWLKHTRPTLTREQYDCLIDNLVDFGFIVGRRQGHSGKLTEHSESILARLRRNLN